MTKINPTLKKVLPAMLSSIIIILIITWFRSTYQEKSISMLPFGTRKAAFTIETESQARVNQPIKVTIKLDTNGQTVNAVGLTMFYESDKMHVTDIDTTSSFCQLYPEKKFNNNTGTITLACGSPKPGFSGQNDILIITFMPTKIGTATFTIDDVSKVLKSDGKGTNIIHEFPSEKITILNSI